MITDFNIPACSIKIWINQKTNYRLFAWNSWKWEGKIPHEILIEALEEIHPRAKIKKYTKNEVLEKFIGIFVVEDKNKISFKKKKTFGATYLGY